MPIATDKTDGTPTTGDHAAHHNALATAANLGTTHLTDTANPHQVTKTQVGLGSADNTTDVAKPVSTAQQTALDLDRARLTLLEIGYAAAPTGVAVTDTAAIQALIDTAATAGGGRVQLRAGTYLVTGLTLKTGVWLIGEGYEATVVRLADAANAHVIKTLAFSTLTGTSNTSTPYNFAIERMTIDGNKANQSGVVHGVAIYGYGYTLRQVAIRNCKGVGLWSEWSSSSLGAVADQLEAFVDHFKIHNCDGVSALSVQGGGTTSATGMVWIGPHDSKIRDGILYYNGTPGGVGSGAVVLDFPTDSNANGTEVDSIHVWGNDPGGAGGGYDTGIRVNGSGITVGSGVEVESAPVAGVYFTVGGNRCDARVYHVGTTYRATGKGVVLASGVSAITGAIRVENCGGGALDVSTGGGGRDLRVNAVYTAIAAPSPVIVGTLSTTTDHIDLLVTDSSGGPTLLNASTSLVRQGSIAGAVRRQPFPSRAENYWKPNGVLYENFSRLRVGTVEATIGTGTLFVFVGPYLYAGDTITNILMMSGSAGATTPTHQWFALLDTSLNVLRKTADDTSVAWGTFSTKTLALSSTYVPAADIQTLGAVLVTAATPPNFRGMPQTAGIAALAPILMGTSTAGLTDPASLGATAGALTQSGGCVPWMRLT
jgi:hypothetical protein